MTRSLAMDANNDLVRGPDGNLAIVTGLAAVTQNCKSIMQTRLGELVLNLQRGIPYFEAAYDDFNPAQFEAASRTMLRTVADVVAVKAFSITRSNSVMSYAVTIQTTYGEVTIDG